MPIPIVISIGLVVLYLTYLAIQKKKKENPATTVAPIQTSTDDKKRHEKIKVEKAYVEKKSWLCLFYFMALLGALYLAFTVIAFILSPFLAAINCGRLNTQTNVLPVSCSQNITVTEEKSRGFRAKDEYGRTLKFGVIEPVESEIWFYDQDGNRKMDKIGIRSFYERDTTKYVYFSKKQGKGDSVKIWLRYE